MSSAPEYVRCTSVVQPALVQLQIASNTRVPARDKVGIHHLASSTPPLRPPLFAFRHPPSTLPGFSTLIHPCPFFETFENPRITGATGGQSDNPCLVLRLITALLQRNTPARGAAQLAGEPVPGAIPSPRLAPTAWESGLGPTTLGN